MIIRNFNKTVTSQLKNSRNLESGQTSKIIIILALVVLVIIVIAFGITKFVTNKKEDASKPSNSSSVTNNPPEPPKPVYEVTLGDVRFLLQSSEDLGKVIKSKSQYEKDLTTTEKFIRVVIAAQNKGKNNIAQYSWNVGNIVDSEGRNFLPINSYSLQPKPDLCGALLKPEFEPISCVRYYEVSKISTKLKVSVRATVPKKNDGFIDLNLNYLPSPPPPSVLPTPSTSCNNNTVCDTGEACIICSPIPGEGCSGCVDCGFCEVQP